MQNLEDPQIVCMNYKSTPKENFLAIGLKTSTKTLPVLKVFSLENGTCYKLIHSNLSPSWQLYETCFCSDENLVLTLAKNGNRTRASLFMVKSEKFQTDIQVLGVPRSLKCLISSKKKILSVLNGNLIVFSKKYYWIYEEEI